jgi:hypothetical protein
MTQDVETLQTAPEDRRVPPQIPRGNILRTWERMLSGDTRTVLVTGPDGIGKTTTLRQFADAHPDSTVSLFLSAASKWAYDPYSVQYQIATQLDDLLGEDRSGKADGQRDVDRVELNRLYARVRRKFERARDPLYFVLDGLDAIPLEDQPIQRQILELIPFGLSDQFRFLVSAATPSSITLPAPVLAEAREAMMTEFDRSSLRRYLEGFELRDEHFEEIEAVTQLLPQSIALVRRQLLDAEDVDALITSLPREAPELFRLQWSGVQRTVGIQALSLAVLAFEEKARSAVDLADLLDSDEDAVRSALEHLRFIDTDSEGRFHYVTESDRRFAQGELKHLSTEVHDVFIKRLLENPGEVESDAQLIERFASAGRMKELVVELDAERFARIYETAPSMDLVQLTAEHGIRAARKLGMDADVLRFVIKKTAVLEIATSAAAIPEVRAFAAVGDLDTALALAEGATRIEDRLRLLAAVVRAQQEQGAAPEPGLMERITEITHKVNPDLLGGRAVDVAIDLLHFAPDLAIQLVSKGAERGENSMDWSLASLVIGAQATSTLREEHGQLEEVRKEIKDPSAQRLSLSATIHLAPMSAGAVIDRAERLETTSDQLYVLQHWILANKQEAECWMVLEKALDLALKTGDYRVNAATFRQLASCLPYIQSDHRANYFVSRFDALRPALEAQGPAEEFHRLQIILARTVWKTDPSTATSRLHEVYNGISLEADPVVKNTSMARLMAALHNIDPVGRVDATLSALVEEDFETGTEALRKWSADHHEVFRGIIRALAIWCPYKAIDVASLLNTEWRRDRAFREMVLANAAAPVAHIDMPALRQALDRIADVDVRNETIASAVSTLIGLVRSEEELRAARPIVELIPQLDDPAELVRLATEVVAAVSKFAGAEELVDEMVRMIDDAWDGVEEEWPKLELCAGVIAAIAKHNVDGARRYIDRYNTLKDRLGCRDSETARAGFYGLLLAIRAYAGLVKHDAIDPEQHEERLLTAIDRCGTLEDQAQLLSHLTVRYYYAGAKHHRRAARIAERLAALVRTTRDDSELRHRRLILTSFPALNLAAPGTASAFLSSTDDYTRNYALFAAANLLLKRVPPGDSYDAGIRRGYDVESEEALRIIALMRRMEFDFLLFDLIVNVVESAEPSRPGGQELINRMQRGEIVRQLEQLIDDKFPDPRHIKHAGYRVASLAYLNRLREGSTRRQHDGLVSDAQSIENVSDRAFVLATIAASVRNPVDRSHVLDRADEAIETIPMLRDRADRYETFGRLLVGIDGHKSREYIRKATQLLLQGEGKSLDERRRSLVDLAYRISPEFANSIAAAFDNDPAKGRVQKQVERHQLVDSLYNIDSVADVPSQEIAMQHSSAAWTRLGRLHAGVMGSVDPKELLPLLQYAAPQPISYAYPLVALFVENAVTRVQHGSADVRAYVSPLYEAVLHAAELAVHTAAGRTNSPSISADRGASGPDTFLIAAGHRAEAIERMREWLRANVGRPLVISEPYFYPQDIGILKLVRELAEDWEVTLLCGQKSLGKVQEPYKTAYIEAWRQCSMDEPPPTFVAFVSRRVDGGSPVHDRWWLTEDSGVYLGTSYNGLGARLSTVRIMNSHEVRDTHGKLAPFLSQRRVHNGERLDYEAFSF